MKEILINKFIPEKLDLFCTKCEAFSVKIIGKYKFNTTYINCDYNPFIVKCNICMNEALIPSNDKLTKEFLKSRKLKN